jgi:hypothetical protein
MSGVPAHFIFNMDEMGHQTWADAREITCFVSSKYEEITIPYPVSRTGQRNDGHRLHYGRWKHSATGHRNLSENIRTFVSWIHFRKVEIGIGNEGYIDLQISMTGFWALLSWI